MIRLPPAVLSLPATASPGFGYPLLRLAIFCFGNIVTIRPHFFP